uniref:Cullin domain-containing protein n=1 Tax=Steinernema glaseri TaxID=37863 RepID=A0A1I8AEK3_9BILA
MPAIDPQKLFDEIRNMHLVEGYEGAVLTFMETRIMYALRELIKHFGGGIFSLETIPTPLREFCRRLQFVIEHLEEIHPLRGEDAVKVYQTTWKSVMKDHNTEVADLISVCRYNDL